MKKLYNPEIKKKALECLYDIFPNLLLNLSPVWKQMFLVLEFSSMVVSPAINDLGANPAV